MKSSTTFFLTTKDFLVSGEEFTLFINNEKDLLITSPVPENISQYYQSKEYISHTDAKDNFLEKVYHFVKKITLRNKLRLLTNQNQGIGKLLDIGSGTGDFLQFANNRNWSVFGVEPNPKARALSKEKGIQVFENLEQIEENSFDVITLWHVLEHIESVDDYILKIKNKLKHNGTLIIAVPNFKSKDANHYREYWAAFDLPRHLWHFSKGAVKRIFEKHHFKLKETKPMWFDAFYVCLLSEKYKTGKSNWLKALWHGSISNLSGMFSKEYSSHIYILKKV